MSLTFLTYGQEAGAHHSMLLSVSLLSTVASNMGVMAVAVGKQRVSSKWSSLMELVLVWKE